MANNENLIPLGDRSEDEQREMRRKGGINSGKTRRKKRDLKESMKTILELDISANQKRQLEELGIDPQGWTLGDVINIMAVQTAIKGNVSAMIYCRDTAGYSPEYQLKYEQFEYEKERKSGQGAEIEDLSDTVMAIWGYDLWSRMLADGVPVLLTKQINYMFKTKHVEYIRNCQFCTYNVLEGAVRSGKTIDHILAFAIELCSTPDKLHLASGSTAGNARLNIGDSNGYGLEHIFRGQCRWGKYMNNDALIIRGPYTNFEEKIVIFAGAGSVSSNRKIRGSSYGLWIATEINLHHDNFIKEAFNRTLAAKRRKFFWDLNPEHPKAHIYTEYIDKYAEKAASSEGLQGGWNYDQFTIYDNASLSQERLDEIVSQYDDESIWFKRDILGIRTIAEGLIYGKLATAIASDNPVYCISKQDAKDIVNSRGVIRINVGVDFGGNGSGHAFVATAETVGYEQLILLRSERYLDNMVDPYSEGGEKKRIGVIDPGTLSQLFVRFIKQIIKDYGFVTKVYADSAEQVLIKGFRQGLADAGLGDTKTVNAAKSRITDRIFATTSLVAQGRFSYVKEDCATFEAAVSMAVWNPKNIELDRLDDGTSDIDTLDAFEYSFERDIKKLIKKPAGR